MHTVIKLEGGVRTSIENTIRATPALTHHIAYVRGQPIEGDINHIKLDGGVFAYLRGLRRNLQRIQPKILHAHSSWAGLYSRASLLRRTSIVYQPHGYAFEASAWHEFMRGLFKLTERVLAKRADVVVVVGRHEELLARRLGSRSVALVPNASQLARTHSSQPPTVTRITTVGRVSAQKDPTFFAQVAAHVTSRRPEVQFVWVGDGDQESRQLLTGAGVEVTGWLDAEGVQDRLEASTLYVHAAAWEGFPIAVLDALALDVPVVLRSIAPFDAEGLNTYADPVAVADAVLALLENSSLAQTELARAKQAVKYMNNLEQARCVKNLYSQLVEDAG